MNATEPKSKYLTDMTDSQTDNFINRFWRFRQGNIFTLRDQEFYLPQIDLFFSFLYKKVDWAEALYTGVY